MAKTNAASGSFTYKLRRCRPSLFPKQASSPRVAWVAEALLVRLAFPTHSNPTLTAQCQVIRLFRCRPRIRLEGIIFRVG